MRPARWPEGSVLAQVSARTREALLGAGSPMVFPVKGVLFRHAERGDSAYLLLAGSVKVFVDSRGGAQIPLGTATEGDLVGETAVLTEDGRRSASVQAATGVEARVLSRAVLRELMVAHPDFAISLHQMTARRLAFANRRRIDATMKDPGVRMGRLLLDTARRPAPGEDPAVALTQHELGFMAMMTPRTAEKVLTEFAECGAIVKEYGSVRILRLDILRTISDLG